MSDSVADPRQLAIYGQSWSDRLTHLMRVYRIPQSRLASVIGLSAPMISQLISGQRVKISNPVVYGRLVRLEELATEPLITAGDPAAVAAALADVAQASPVLTTRSMPIGRPPRDTRPNDELTARLRSIADPQQLLAVARTARAIEAVGLAELLEAAAANDPPR